MILITLQDYEIRIVRRNNICIYAVAQAGLIPWRIAGSGTGQEPVFCNYSNLPDGFEQKMF